MGREFRRDNFRGWALVWQLAGVLGVDPGPLTLRELAWMAEAQIEQQWAHTSSVLAMLANVNRDRKKQPRPFKPSDFDPTKQGKRQQDIPKADISVLKQVFVDGQ